MAERTENYGLTLWGAEDKVEREGVNGNFEAVDAVMAGKAEGTAVAALQSQVAGKAELVFGTYTGNGAASRTISLGFTPRAVILENSEGKRFDGGSSTGVIGGLALPGCPVEYVKGYPALSVAANGFQIALTDYSYMCNTNVSGKKYYYIAAC